MLQLLARRAKLISWFFITLFYLELILVPSNAGAVPIQPVDPVLRLPHIRTDDHAGKEHGFSMPVQETTKSSLDKFFTGGPSQPEMQAFSPVSNANMVDLFTGDFSYSIPLADVGGYPINLSYSGGISMDQDASWVGLGWNVNPGTITRNLRGLPDDFNGINDSVRKTTSIRENKTIGVTAGANVELVGVPLGIGASLGVFHNNYRGWGLESAINVSINSGSNAKGPLSGGLSVTNNSQEGLTVAPSLSLRLWQYKEDELNGATGSFSVALPYNSRSGLKGLQLSTGVRQYSRDAENQNKSQGYGSSFSSTISFATSGYTPSITIPFTSRQFSFTGRVGLEKKVYNPSFFISGYVSKQRIAPADTALALPSFGYLYYQDGAKNRSALLDFNREKELPYREKPAVPHIAIPSYTYDAFSITGEGTGGMFRAYRGDIGFIYDHHIRTKDESDRLNVDVGIADLVHAGVDLNINRAFTQNGPWLDQNPLQQIIDFRSNAQAFEAVYFRNPGEKSINSKQFYEAIGGDDVVTVGLFQADNSSSVIQTTNYLTRYRNKRPAGAKLLTPLNAVKQERDKRSQVISYLTAKEAAVAGLSKYIENYTTNQFTLNSCTPPNLENVEGNGPGLPAEYYPAINFAGVPFQRTDAGIVFDWVKNPPLVGFPGDNFSIRWKGRIKAPATGTYTFTTTTDDGVRLWLNDSLIINDWRDHAATATNKMVNLVAGEFYDLRMEYYEKGGKASVKLEWAYPGQPKTVIPGIFLYPPGSDLFVISSDLIKEKRVNHFRKENHISQITVLNNDGRQYVYGIPAYSLKQKEATFAVNGKDRGNKQTGLTGYNHGTDNTAAGNQHGKDRYYNSEIVPAYAHSFLLTGILSTDYADITGNGISDDDVGDAIKFNYSKICGIANPFRWRAPYATDSVTFNEGLRTDYRDDKGNYVYGEKELWYLHSIESKTMVATFTVENRDDMQAMDERGQRYNDGSAKRLKEINIYSKSDFLKWGITARPIKTVHFEYSYKLCPGINGAGTAKLTLEKVWFTYNGNSKGKQNPFVFSYNAKNPSYNIKSYDRWGNYKDPLQNPGSTPANPLTNAEHPYALQDSAAAAANAAAWTLDSIRLPSGGALKIDYESDDYAYVQNKRAMQLFKIAGLGSNPSIPTDRFKLYTPAGDNLYVFVKIPSTVSTAQDVYRQYLADIKKLYFRLFVNMPGDIYGTGSEYVTCYADLASGGSYGVVNANTIWIKLDGISLKGDGPGNFSPLAKAAIQYLRLNLPSKAYPGSEVGDNIDLDKAVRLIASMGDNIRSAFESYDATARGRKFVTTIDTSRSYVRLNNPVYKKYGGGHRVKRITLYDNWDKMTGQRAAIYGQQYIYTTRKEINGARTTISSGVASYEPTLGGDENPFHVPIEYVEKIAPLGPVTLGYSEEPLGESFFPSARVGYSSVRVRTINFKNKKSANGYEETKFHTAYDFPTYTDRTMLDNDTKKRYKPALANFLRVNAKHYISLSQGFKVELNDMHGKLRSKATYAETDSVNPVSYTEQVYRVEDPKAEFKRLANTVMAMRPNGEIDTAALIGKDVEIMVDMREQLSIINGYNVNLNTELFTIPFPLPPFFLIPSFLNLAQREENIYRSAATVKIIQRYGILDSVILIDKGSRISTKEILYDSETGNVLLTRTQNEFNDPVYNFDYPAHWAYDGMGPAYRNIDVTLSHITIRDGRISTGLGTPDSLLFSTGDEILVAGKQKTGTGAACADSFSTFPLYNKIWAIDSSVITGGAKRFYFIDRSGKPYNGYDISLKIVRSGRRNMAGSIGSVTTLDSPIRKNVSGNYALVLNTASKVIKTSAAEFGQFWKVEDIKRTFTASQCVPFAPDECVGDPGCTCRCLRTLFDYLIQSKRLFITEANNVTVSSLVQDANNAGFTLSANDCPLLFKNSGKKFYALTADSITTLYRARIGDCTVKWQSLTGNPVGLYKLKSKACESTGLPVSFYDSTLGPQYDTVSKRFYVTKSITSRQANIVITKDSNTTRLRAGTTFIPNGNPPGSTQSDDSRFQFHDSVMNMPPGWSLVAAYLHLYGDQRGYDPPIIINAHSLGRPLSVMTPFLSWTYSDDVHLGASNHIDTPLISQPFQDLTINVTVAVSLWHFRNRNTGFWLNTNHHNAERFSSFYSQRYSDTSKHPKLDVVYRYQLPIDQAVAELDVESCLLCDTIVDNSCRSIVVDTVMNPYVTGVLGNWRPNKNYVYYIHLAETDPAVAANSRHAGAFSGFAPFWNFQSNLLKPLYDTSRWVWNSEITLYNRRGLEIENRDAMGRYSAGLYGYNLTLPAAIAQNSRNRESAFEGFEDYNFATQLCDTACTSAKHIDFKSYKAGIDTTQKHSGKSSLRLNASQQAALSFALTAPAKDGEISRLNFALKPNSCSPDGQTLESIKATDKILLPSFSPTPGAKMVVSAWVKEDQDCKCVSYTNNRILISFSGGSSSSIIFIPTGAIIDGWQRYEGNFEIPADATGMTVSLEATGSATVYFDDLRIHPFNANMRSFVYHPVNLRLMAELDENNYATFYEYDDDGTLSRLKKETERGIKTLQETRSALVKE